MKSDYPNEPFVEYRGLAIVHSGGKPRPRLNDSFTIHDRRTESGGTIVHLEPATGAIYERESQALVAAHARAKAWIDEEMSRSD